MFFKNGWTDRRRGGGSPQDSPAHKEPQRSWWGRPGRRSPCLTLQQKFLPQTELIWTTWHQPPCFKERQISLRPKSHRREIWPYLSFLCWDVQQNFFLLQTWTDFWSTKAERLNWKNGGNFKPFVPARSWQAKQSCHFTILVKCLMTSFQWFPKPPP